MQESSRKLWYLQRINFFAGLSAEGLSRLGRLSEMERVARRQPIFLPGDPAKSVYLLKSGRVRISRVSPEGREVTLALLEPGQIFGELAVVEDSPQDSVAEALDDVELCRIGREDFLALLREHPELTLRLTKLIGMRLKRIERKVEDLVFRDTQSRLAALILDLAEEWGTDQHGTGDHPARVLRLSLTHQQIASLVGATRETISALLGELKRSGILDQAGRKIVVCDLARLKALAKREAGAESAI